MLAKLTDARFSGDIWNNAIWNLDDVSKWENICRMTFLKYGFRPVRGIAYISTANEAKRQKVGQYFPCWGPCPRTRWDESIFVPWA